MIFWRLVLPQTLKNSKLVLLETQVDFSNTDSKTNFPTYVCLYQVVTTLSLHSALGPKLQKVERLSMTCQMACGGGIEYDMQRAEGGEIEYDMQGGEIEYDMQGGEIEYDMQMASGGEIEYDMQMAGDMQMAEGEIKYEKKQKSKRRRSKGVSKPIASGASSARVSKPIASSAGVSKPLASARVSSAGVSKPIASAGISKPIASAGASKPIASAGVSKPIASGGGVSKPIASEVAKPMVSASVSKPGSKGDVKCFCGVFQAFALWPPCHCTTDESQQAEEGQLEPYPKH